MESSAGGAVTGLEISGLVEKSDFWELQPGNSFAVKSYDPASGRSLFFRTRDLSLVGHYQLKGKAPDDMRVALQPSVTVTGRLIETETGEPAAGYSFYCHDSSCEKFRIGGNSFSIEANEEGRFEIPGMIAGLTYQIHTANVQRFSSRKNNFTIDLTNAKPGSKVELGDVNGKNAKQF